VTQSRSYEKREALDPNLVNGILPRRSNSGQRLGLRKSGRYLFEAIANGSVVSWQNINLQGNAKLKDSVRIQSSKLEARKRSDFGSSEKTYLVVYIRVVVNRVAFYVPLLEYPHHSQTSVQGECADGALDLKMLVLRLPVCRKRFCGRCLFKTP
jgi:hypothetical protein